MDDLIGGIFSILWFLFVVGMIKKAANKKNGKKSSGTGFLKSQMKAMEKESPKESLEIEDTEDSDAFAAFEALTGITTSSGSRATAGKKARVVTIGRQAAESESSAKSYRPGRHEPKAGEARPAKAALLETSALSELMVEDRQHDWLARQIREEKKHVVWNNFIDLGAAHDEACAAELNRMEHKRQHQSYVVDDGELED